MREPGPWARDLQAQSREGSKAGIEGKRPERDESRVLRQEGNFSFEILPAVGELARSRTVSGRRAPAGGRDDRACQRQAVAPPAGLGLVRKSGLVERAEEKVAGFISREDPARPVAAMRRWGEADEQDTCARIAESRERLRPVALSAKPAGRIPRGSLPPGDEPGTAAAGDDLTLDPAEAVGRTLSPESTSPSGRLRRAHAPSWRARRPLSWRKAQA
jgi:hypothetical protein